MMVTVTVAAIYRITCEHNQTQLVVLCELIHSYNQEVMTGRQWMIVHKIMEAIE